MGRRGGSGGRLCKVSGTGERSPSFFSALGYKPPQSSPFPRHPLGEWWSGAARGLCPFLSVRYLWGRGGRVQPAPRRIERTPRAAVSGGPGRLCAGSEAGRVHPRSPAPSSFPSWPRGYGRAIPAPPPVRGPCGCLPPPCCPVTRGWSLFPGCAWRRLPRAEWLGRGDRASHLGRPGGNGAARDAPAAGFCGRAPAGSRGLWLCTCRPRGVRWGIGFESRVIFSEIL